MNAARILSTVLAALLFTGLPSAGLADSTETKRATINTEALERATGQTTTATVPGTTAPIPATAAPIPGTAPSGSSSSAPPRPKLKPITATPTPAPLTATPTSSQTRPGESQTSAPNRTPSSSTLMPGAAQQRPAAATLQKSTAPRPSVPDRTSATTRGSSSTSQGRPEPSTTNSASTPASLINPAAGPLGSGSLMGSAMPEKQTLTLEKSKSTLREIITVAKNLKEAEQHRRALSALGLKIKQRKKMDRLGIVLSIFIIPEDISFEEVKAYIDQQLPDANTEFNQRYELLSDAKTYSKDLVGMPATTCSQPVHIAMLDSAVNTQSKALTGKNISRIDISSSSNAHKHGSSIAHLLVGSYENFQGLLPNATLYTINVFDIDKDKKAYTQTDWLVAGFNQLAGLNPKPAAVNLSFGGGYSFLLQWIINFLGNDMYFIAAAGNNGSNEALYPAAYDNVIAVSAVDKKLRRYKQANYGDFIDLTAPGVDIWTYNEKMKGFYATGTSYAAPFVTAAAALAGSEKDLFSFSKDIGDKGRDQFFGEGLINFSKLCQN